MPDFELTVHPNSSLNQSSPTSDFLIRPLRAGDAQALMDFINPLSAEKTFINKQGQQISLEGEITYVNNFLANQATGQACKFILVDQARATIVGACDIVLGRLVNHHVGLLGIALSAGYRGVGLGEQLLRTTLEQASSFLPDLEIVKLAAFAENQAALHLYQKLGFQIYGQLPRGIKTTAGYHDEVLLFLNIRDYLTTG